MDKTIKHFSIRSKRFLPPLGIGCVLLMIAIATVSTACTDIIEKEPILDTSVSSIFSSKSAIETYLEGVYKRLGEVMPNYVYQSDMRGDDFDDPVQNGGLSANDMNLSVSDTSAPWNGFYQAIGEANDFIGNLDAVKEIAGKDYDRYKSEAKFVRALSYYYLVVLYARTYHLNPKANAIPLRTETPESSTNNLAPSSIEKIHDQILSDLSDENIANLSTERNSVKGVTHATQAAAHALRQRIYMEEWNWDKAIEEGLAIKGYALGSLTAIFAAPYYTEESIFSFPYSVNNPNGIAKNEYQGSWAVLEDFYSGIYSIPEYAVETDIRKAQLTHHPTARLATRKYSDLSGGGDWIPVFRYAETLLNLSEAYFNRGNEGDEEIAKEYLRQVRSRSITAEDDPINIDELSGDNLKAAIYNERRTEFAGEGLRSIDIHRRGDAFIKKVGSNKELNVKPADYGYIWPIPLSETSQNKLIKADN